MTTALLDAPTEEYVSAADCIRAHPSLCRPKLYRAVAVQAVRVQLLPGHPPRYHLADVARLVADPRSRRPRKLIKK